VTRNW